MRIGRSVGLSDCLSVFADGQQLHLGDVPTDQTPFFFALDSSYDLTIFDIESELQATGGDEGVDITEFMILHTPHEIGSESVPEPGTLAIFGLGVVGLGFMRRRRVA